ncbi:MAG: DNA polymerase Y family protein, partial [Gemmatimonadetes bacterium]|nr:DNA polymerase Y family protein [Gemmatimonadota bacterium]
MASDPAASSGREAPTRRIVAAWLPWWPTERLGRELPEALSHPFVTVAEGRDRLIIEACSPVAARAGLGPGMTLADGRAIVPEVVVRPADP